MERLRVLMISSCFPHPGNERLGVWALSQAETLARHGVDLKVVSPTSYVPRILGRLGIAPWAANCPDRTRLGMLDVTFPRWTYYYVGLFRPIIKHYPNQVFHFGWLTLKNQLLAEIKQHQPDVIFANHTLDGGESARRLHRITGLPFVVAEHDFGEITDCATMPSRHRHYSKVITSASSVLAVSERMKSDIERIFPKARVVVARYGRDPLPPEFFRTARPAELAGKTIVLSACSLTHRKDVPRLVEAFARAASGHPDAVLRIAGGGPEREAIEAAIRRFDVRGQVQLLGPLPHDQLLQEMAWANVFALTGWDEPFATVYVEALAARLPIVCCNDGGICDVLEDGVQGFAVPPRDVNAVADRLSRLLENPDLRQQMSANAHSLFQERLTPASYAGTIIQELQRAVETRKHPQP